MSYKCPRQAPPLFCWTHVWGSVSWDHSWFQVLSVRKRHQCGISKQKDLIRGTTRLFKFYTNEEVKEAVTIPRALGAKRGGHCHNSGARRKDPGKAGSKLLRGMQTWRSGIPVGRGTAEGTVQQGLGWPGWQDTDKPRCHWYLWQGTVRLEPGVLQEAGG